MQIRFEHHFYILRPRRILQIRFFLIFEERPHFAQQFLKQRGCSCKILSFYLVLVIVIFYSYTQI